MKFLGSEGFRYPPRVLLLRCLAVLLHRGCFRRDASCPLVFDQQPTAALCSTRLISSRRSAHLRGPEDSHASMVLAW